MSTLDSLSRRAALAAGQPISELMRQALAHPELISLAAGFVDQATLPVEATRAAFDEVFHDPRWAQAALQYGTPAGHLPLREAVLAALVENDGAAIAGQHLSVEQVLVTAGSNELLHLLVDTLCDPGDIVLVPEPTYFVFLGMLRNLGVRAIGVTADEQGLVPEALDEELARLAGTGELARVKALYVVSYFDNPSSVTLSEERRGPVVETIKRHSRHGTIRIIEDAAYRELRYGGPNPPSMRSFDAEGDTVVLTETFSKSFSPGIRVGWGFLPRDLVEPLSDQKGNIDFGSPNLSQHVMAAVMDKGLLRPHVEKLRDNYRKKLAATLAACEEHLRPIPGVHWSPPRGGLYVWLTLPDEIATGPGGTLFEHAVEEGVLYVPGEYSYAGQPHEARTNTIRMSFGVQSVERIRRGVEGLTRAIRRTLEQ
ncbi:MAG: PLP-dependent aminotransferase family protein [Planctomycetia bacterium]|nr:PLP-dependent aminotransferase family protein [Planctomycetia bacterium]